MRRVSGFHHKYYRILPAFGILFLINLFLPYVKMDGQFINGFKMLALDVNLGKTTSLVELFFGGMGALIFAILTAITIFLFIVFPSKKRSAWPIAMNSIYLVLQISSFIYLKKIFDTSGLFEQSFMIRDLQIGFWLTMILGFASLYCVMAAVRISPGYIILVILSVMWLFPVFYIVMNAFRQEGSFYVNYVIPKDFGIENFKTLLQDDTKFHYIRWFKNTLVVSILSCILSSFIVLCTSYTISRIRFVGRRVIMNLLLVLGMFPPFMSMIAVYYILKGIGLAQSLIALVLVYSGSAALTYYVAKGFFDTIPKALDEAAFIDGASKWTVFTHITIPLSKPIIIYTVMTSFMAPWGDYIFASVILGDKSKSYTIAMGLFDMLSKENIDKYFTQFAAGAVLISIPIAILFISLQKFYVEGLSGSVKG